MQENEPQKSHYVLGIVLGAAVIVIVILCVLLIGQYRRVQRLDYIRHRQSLLSSLHGSGPLTTLNASSTQAWMTFDYVNRVFALPPEYLKTTLAISDRRYPRLTIAKYAATTGLSQSTTLLKVQDAIRAFFSAPQ